MDKRKEFIKHLAQIYSKQINEEYKNFLIGVLRMDNFENWENILTECDDLYKRQRIPMYDIQSF